MAGKTNPEITPLLLEGSVKAMTTNGMAFQKRKWWQSMDDELAEYDKNVEVWISNKQIELPAKLLDYFLWSNKSIVNQSGRRNPKLLLDALETLLISSSTKDDPHTVTALRALKANTGQKQNWDLWESPFF